MLVNKTHLEGGTKAKVANESPNIMQVYRMSALRNDQQTLNAIKNSQMSFHKPRPGKSNQVVVNREGPSGQPLEERGHTLRILHEMDGENDRNYRDGNKRH